jgi:hypothetical protein
MITRKIARKKIDAVKHQVRRMMINLFLGVKIRNLLPKSQNCLAVERTLITVEMVITLFCPVFCSIACLLYKFSSINYEFSTTVVNEKQSPSSLLAQEVDNKINAGQACQ